MEQCVKITDSNKEDLNKKHLRRVSDVLHSKFNNILIEKNDSRTRMSPNESSSSEFIITEQKDAIKNKSPPKISVAATILPPPPPPPPPPCSLLRQLPVRPNFLLPQLSISTRTKQMRILRWNKISPHEIYGETNLWSKIDKNHANQLMRNIDWQEVEFLFSSESTPNSRCSKCLRTNRESNKILLLDVKKSIQIDICLKQFKGVNIFKLIKTGNHEITGADNLKALLNLLPNNNEQALLITFNGDYERLGEMEKFLIQLMEISDFKLRIESMILKHELIENCSRLHNYIICLTYAGDDILNNKSLHEILYIIVIVGNYLNTDIEAGNAGGIQLSSLNRLTSLRCNTSGMNFMNFLVKQVEKLNSALLNFAKELCNLETACKINVDQLIQDAKKLKKSVQTTKTEIEMSNTAADLKKQMLEFIPIAERQLETLQEDIDNIETMRLMLCEFFCEKPSNFKLNDCFAIIQTFAVEFENAVKKNEELRKMEEKRISRQIYKDNEKSVPKVNISNESEKDDILKSMKALSFGSKNSNVRKRAFKRKGYGDYNRERTATSNAVPIRTCGRNSNKNEITEKEFNDDDERQKLEKVKKIGRRMTDVSEADLQKVIQILQSPNDGKTKDCHQDTDKEFIRKKSLEKVRKIGRRMSILNDEDLKDTIKILRPSNGEKSSYWHRLRQYLNEERNESAEKRQSYEVENAKRNLSNDTEKCLTVIASETAKQSMLLLNNSPSIKDENTKNVSSEKADLQRNNKKSFKDQRRNSVNEGHFENVEMRATLEKVEKRGRRRMTILNETDLQESIKKSQKSPNVAKTSYWKRLYRKFNEDKNEKLKIKRDCSYNKDDVKRNSSEMPQTFTGEYWKNSSNGQIDSLNDRLSLNSKLSKAEHKEGHKKRCIIS